MLKEVADRLADAARHETDGNGNEEDGDPLSRHLGGVNIAVTDAAMKLHKYFFDWI